MTVVRSYVQELINHAIVTELEFPISWKVFELQFPKLEEKYLANVALLEKTLDSRFEPDGNKIIWLLTQKETNLIANAAATATNYLLKILYGHIPTMEALAADPDFKRAGIAVEKSYGKDAGRGDNTIGKWTPIQSDTALDMTFGTYQEKEFPPPDPFSPSRVITIATNGDLYKFGGIVKIPATGKVFRDDKVYYTKQDDEYTMLVVGEDYHIGDLIEEFSNSVYQDSVLEGELLQAYFDFMTGNDASMNIAFNRGWSYEEPPEFTDKLKVKFGNPRTDNMQEPTILNVQMSALEPVSGIFEGYTVEDAYWKYSNCHITNIADLNSKGIALFHYDRNYDWEKDVSQNKTITSNLHIRKLIKGWFGHGKTGWSKDINSIPYVQTLDEHEWASAYKKHVERYARIVRGVRVDELLGLVAGNPDKFYLLFLIANLYAVRHELLSIYFRALNEIRKKGLYRV